MTLTNRNLGRARRSVCDPLKLKMTPKVNYLGVTMTPENFFEGKTLESTTTKEYVFVMLSHSPDVTFGHIEFHLPIGFPLS